MAPSHRILVVDDEVPLLLTLTANLELEGFDVVGVERGAAALAEVQAREFDLVLSDIRMPGMTGIELFSRIKALRPNLPVVLMTGFAVEEQVEDVMSRGAFAVLPKPFDIDKAMRVLANATRRPEVLVVVEGLAQSATTIASGMTAMGVAARGFGDSAAALAALGQGPVDVCVNDLGAPQTNGATTLAKFRAADPLLTLIGIAPADNTVNLTSSARSTDALVKRPFQLKELIKLICKTRARGVK